MAGVTDFIYETKSYIRSQWYTDPKSGDIMEASRVVTERVPVAGEPPPGFHRFIGRGSVEVDTVMGRGEITFDYPIIPAETIEDAFEYLEAAEKHVRPKIIAQAKEQAVEQHEMMRKQIVVPGGPNMPPGARPPQGPFGLV